MDDSEPERITAPPGAPDFLVHRKDDHVAVAVQDVAAGSRRAVYLDSDSEASVDVLEPVPLGHKVALVNLAAEAEVIEYGAVIGRTRAAIGKGQMVHVHNLRSARWEKSR
ncbi:MAG: UxaA family hydrolase [Candidatus Dormibacteraceae bacterium]